MTSKAQRRHASRFLCISWCSLCAAALGKRSLCTSPSALSRQQPKKGFRLPADELVVFEAEVRKEVEVL